MLRYNVCIAAYGQTGAGKTHTMMGSQEDPGVNKRAVQELLKHLQASEVLEYDIQVSIMEVYNEQVYDLLCSASSREDSKRKLRQTPRGVEVIGITKRTIQSQLDIWRIFKEGEKNRSVRSTESNHMSSRSHLLLKLTLTTRNKVSGIKMVSSLLLADLAGSERVKKSEVTGDALKEAAAVNKSLSALGLVFMAIHKNNPHIPFKNSVLTQLLSDSLRKQAKCAMFINISPQADDLPETMAALRFAESVCKIEQGEIQPNRGTPHHAPISG